MQIYKHKHLKQKKNSQNVGYNRTGIAICRGFLQRPNLFVLERDEFVWTLILDENPTRHKSLRYFFIMSYQTRMTQNTSESLYMQLRLFHLESSRSKTIFPRKKILEYSFYLSKQSEQQFVFLFTNGIPTPKGKKRSYKPILRFCFLLLGVEYKQAQVLILKLIFISLIMRLFSNSLRILY